MTDLSQVFGEEWPRVVGATLRSFGSIDLAEESAQEAFARAAERLAGGDRIDNIGAWATTVARRIAIDSIRRDAVLRAKLPLLVDEPEEDPAPEQDDRLGLIFVACDPAISAEQQIALALRIVCGVPTSDIADFFGVQEATVAARLTRAKKAIAAAGVDFEWPGAERRATRLDAVLTTIYGVYTLGHTAAIGSDLVDARLAELALLLAESVASDFPDTSEVMGLVAIIELGEGRRPGRMRGDGMPLTLAEVDRSAWGRQRIRRGLDLATRALPGGGRFALQAGIAGLHSSAETWEQTDWSAISTLYFGLLRVWPAPVVRLGSIVARSHLGPSDLTRAIRELRELAVDAPPEFQRRVHSALADAEERAGHPDRALRALDLASQGESNEALLRYYDRARQRLQE